MEETSEYGKLGRPQIWETSRKQRTSSGPFFEKEMHQEETHRDIHQSCSEERIEVLSNTIERYHSSRNTPSLLYSESCSDGNWRSHFRKVFCVTSASWPQTKISLKHDWMKEFGSEVARQPEGEVVQLCEVLPLSRHFRNQPIDSCTLQEQKHCRYLFANVRLCQLLSIAWDRSRILLR